MQQGSRSRLAITILMGCSLIVSFISVRNSDRVLQPQGNVPASSLITPVESHNSKEEERPPFNTLVQGQKIVGNVQFLLDFAIVGFAKCSTSSMIQWIQTHPESQVLPGENKDLRLRQPIKLVSKLYHDLPEGSKYKRGYKNPGDLKFFHAIEYLGEYFPSTRLLIALRHPLLRFESFYNFRAGKGKVMPPPNKLVGPCHRMSRGVCTDSAALHEMLARLGKTNMTSSQELALLGNGRRPVNRKQIPNKVFLYTIDQLADTNHSNVFANDIQRFIGFQQEMPPIPQNKKNYSAFDTSKMIEICDSHYEELRAILMKHARASSRWIREYFLKSEDVFVSSPRQFEDILKGWMHDPCQSRAAATKK